MPSPDPGEPEQPAAGGDQPVVHQLHRVRVHPTQACGLRQVDGPNRNKDIGYVYIYKKYVQESLPVNI